MVVVLVMDRELVQLLPVKFASTVSTDPGEELQRTRSVGLFVTAPYHESLQKKGDSSYGLLYTKSGKRHHGLKTVRTLFFARRTCKTRHAPGNSSRVFS